MLKLPNITLVGIDCYRPEGTLKSMQYSMRQVKFARAILATDTERHVWIRDAARARGIEVFHRKQTDYKEIVHGRALPLDYERDVLTLTHRLFSTEFCLFQEWDGCVINTGAWNHEFTEYDYVGAPWPYPFTEKGWPDCTEENCVGNGGFTLKSYAWCCAIAELARNDKDKESIKSSDRWQCRTARPRMEQLGFKYAPYDVARRFSCEDAIYTGQFGYHGETTAIMNGWDFTALI